MDTCIHTHTQHTYALMHLRTYTHDCSRDWWRLAVETLNVPSPQGHDRPRTCEYASIRNYEYMHIDFGTWKCWCMHTCIHVCVCLRIYICTLQGRSWSMCMRAHRHTNIHTHDTPTCKQPGRNMLCLCVCVCVCVHLYIYIYIYKYLCIYVCQSHACFCTVKC